MLSVKGQVVNMLPFAKHIVLVTVTQLCHCRAKWKVTQSCLTLCDPMDCGLSVSSVHGILQARILKWVATSGDLKCSFLQWIFPTQRLNPGLPHHRWILYHLSHQGSPKSKGNQKQKHEYACSDKTLLTKNDQVLIHLMGVVCQQLP